MIDLGFVGPRFTWTTLRYHLGLVQEHLDRTVANPSWRQNFPKAKVKHLPRVHSDHCLVLLTLNTTSYRRGVKPFHFEPMWFSQPNFLNLVKESWSEGNDSLQNAIICFRRKANIWNREVFGNVFLKKKSLSARLAGI